MRLPLCGLFKKFHAKQETSDAIMKVLSWSFGCLASGKFPSCRHDGSPWTAMDKTRKKTAGKDIGVRGVLAEVRGDWQFFSSVFRFPAWNKKSGCCWMCPVTPATMGDFSSQASWRTQRLSWWDLLARWTSEGTSISPIFSSPFVTSCCFAVDWLHAVDLGVTLDFLGNLFWHILPLLNGDSRLLQVQALFQKIQSYYSRANPSSKPDDLTVKMICMDKKGPKLRAKAAEARGLVPFGVELAEEMLTDPGDHVGVTIRECARHLQACYDNLSRAEYDADSLSNNCRLCCVLYKSLSDFSAKPRHWKLKPKFHLFAELTGTGNCPSLQWTYRDEDFGGFAAKLSRRRGGKNTVLSTGRAWLLKFLANNLVPCL